MNKINFTESDLKNTVPNCRNFSELARILEPEMSPYSSRKILKRMCKNLGIDTSHFTGGPGWSRGLKLGPKVPLEYYLKPLIKSTIRSSKIKARLFEEGYFKKECSSCGISKWLGKSAPLELDHIDGNNLNHTLSNLRILCPNCHAFTETYRGKNKRLKRIQRELDSVVTNSAS